MARTEQRSNEGDRVPVKNKEQQQQHEQGLERQRYRGGLMDPFWSSSPFLFMRRFSEDMDRLFGEFGFGTTGSTGGEISRREFGRGIWRPQIEVFQRGDDLVFRADLPGMNKDDVKVECTRDAIIIEGERKHEHSEEREGRYHSERSYGQFYRSIPLPEGVQTEDAKATFKDGVLEIVMKAPEESRPKKIEIQS